MSNSRATLGAASVVVVGMVCQQVGAAISITLFSLVGPVGILSLRVAFGTIILLLVFRPSLRGRTRGDWLTALAFGLALASMNTLFYLALPRLNLGVVLTFEILGPLVLSVVVSRRLSSWLWAGLAFTGVALLGLGGASSFDPLGVVFAVGAGVAWAGYIVLSARTGQRFGRLDGLVFAMMAAAVVVLPLGITSAGADLVQPRVLLLGAVVAVLSSVIPYGLELLALRRLPAPTFSILLALAPAVAAIVGLLLLGQQLTVTDAIAIALVVAASMGAVRAASRAVRPLPEAGELSV